MARPTSRSRRTPCLCMAAGWVVLAAMASASGQDDGRRIYDEQLRVQIDQQMPEAREMGFDAGGWFNFALFKYDDGTKWRTLRQYELRPWASLNLQGVHQFYIRAVASYDDWNTGTYPTGVRNDDLVGPNLDRAWYQLDLGQLYRNQTGQVPPVGLRFKVGRDYADIGTALVLSMPMDLVQLEVSPGDWEFKALLGKTIKSTRNIDDSELVAGHQERCFWGVQATYKGFTNHRPFAYFLDNRDHTRPKPDDPFQEYEYNSRYVGIGSRGSLVLPNLRYLTELVGQWGRTKSESYYGEQDRICAMAFDAQLEYLFEREMHPRVSVEYLFATGDSDRRLSSTATAGGNQPGTPDHAFNAFGFRDLGIAFAPRLSNLHVYSVGAAFFPLEKIELFRRMEVGSKAFFYHKASGGGPISDTSATRDSQWVGWEWDLYCDWRITSDLTWTIRYGAFQPGAAFTDNSCRQFLYTGITLSF